ncbi:MBL fold metallo-hydrolase [Candidatus Dojkabacteria bacterium]|nr:MBL fold metallo-hydrolase [Candidatus Dojkabacteria bacterium]
MKGNIWKLYAVVILIWLIIIWIKDVRDNSLSVVFLDVGQGDSIIVRAPDGWTMLIDGGGGDYVLSQLGKVLPPWVRKIDVILLTHPHADHLRGLLEVIERYEVEEIWWNPVYYQFSEYDFFVDSVGEIGVAVDSEVSRYVNRDVSIEVLWPLSEDGNGISEEEMLWCDEHNILCSSRFDDNVNNDSVVIFLSYQDFDLLLMGDAEYEVEEVLLKIGSLHDVEVLKAGHHCSRTASSEEFIGVVRPELAVCSCGEGNKFGHPHKETLNNFDEFGVEYLRTDKIGNVVLKSDGEKWWIE